MNEHLYKKEEGDISVHDDFGLNETGNLERGKLEAENLEPEGLEIEDLEAALEENLEMELGKAQEDDLEQEPDGMQKNVRKKELARRGRSRAKGKVKISSPQTEEEVEAEVDEFLKNLRDGDRKDGRKGQRKSLKNGKKGLLIAGGVLAAAVLAAGGVYAGMAQKYKTVYFPNTQINGVDASGMTVAEVKELISAGTKDYVLRIEERGGAEEEITGASIGLHPEFNGALEQLLAAQNPYEWGFYQMNLRSDMHSLETMVVYDEAGLEEQIAALSCLLPENQVEPENAKISAYVSGQGYSLVPETEGSVILAEALKLTVTDGIKNLQESVSLEEAGVYKEPEIRSDDEALTEQLHTMNRYAGVTVTYRFGDKTEVLNGDRIHEWISVNADGSVALSSSGVASYVEELAAEYNTSSKAKNLKTSYGKTVQVKGGSYGWRINQSAEADELAAIIRSGESQTREPVYGQKAASHGENDYGDTYVEINLTAQHLFFYKEGKLVVESDFVSGNVSKGWGTPAGTYSLTYKQKNAVLKGENYETPVDYWMPFNGGIGLHDATWRSSFGGTIYKTGGSHGCINLPHRVAGKIYENISAGVPVICYNLSGTEKTTASTTKKTETEAAATTAATAAPAEATAAAPAETTAAPAVKPATGQTTVVETSAAAETTAPAETAGTPTVKPATGQTTVVETQAAETKAPAETQAQSPGSSGTSQTQTTGGPGSGGGSSDSTGGGSGPASAR